MTMNMCIVMNMNIYITTQNTKSLKAEENMSGLVNLLLKKHYSMPNCKCDAFPTTHSHLEADGVSHNIRPDVMNEPTYAPVELPKKTDYTALMDKAITEAPPKLKVLDNDALKELLARSGKQPITSEPTHICKDNCKHWVWDSNSGKYNNSLTGEVRNAPEF